jgi:hypothetical protein
LIDGLVVSDPYGGKYEDRMAVYAAERFTSRARNPAVVLACRTGDYNEDEFRAPGGCLWVN